MCHVVIRVVDSGRCRRSASCELGKRVLLHHHMVESLAMGIGMFLRRTMFVRSYLSYASRVASFVVGCIDIDGVSTEPARLSLMST